MIEFSILMRVLQPNDVIILWAYGNDLMENHVYREGSKFHLRRFCPHSSSYR